MSKPFATCLALFASQWQMRVSTKILFNTLPTEKFFFVMLQPLTLKVETYFYWSLAITTTTTTT